MSIVGDYLPTYRPTTFGPLTRRPAATDFGIGLWRDENGQEWWSNGQTWTQAMEPFMGESYDMMNPGEEVMGRDLVTTPSVGAGSSGDIRLGWFTARRAEPITQLRLRTGTTAAGATPSLVRWGVWVENPDLSLDLVASTANDTTVFAAASTVYTRSLTATWNKVRGQRYAIGSLIVTGAAMPSLAGGASNPDSAMLALAPRLTGSLSGQADLPAHITPGSLAVSASRYGWVMLP